MVEPGEPCPFLIPAACTQSGLAPGHPWGSSEVALSRGAGPSGVFLGVPVMYCRGKITPNQWLKTTVVTDFAHGSVIWAAFSEMLCF